MSALAALVLVWMVTLQSPQDPALLVSPELAASYPETAQEIADAAEADPLLGDAQMTAALLTVWAQRESRFSANPCTKQWPCDGGASRGRWQTWRGWGDPTAETALKLMHTSFRICAKHPLSERASWFAMGGSGCEKRNELSRSRMHAAAKLLREVRP